MRNERAERAMREFLEALGLDLAREGMERTPERVAAMYEDLFSGMGRGTRDIWGETFEAGPAAGGIVALRGIPFCSVCEHHLAPFFGEAHIAYLPAPGKVAGFGCFAQLVDRVARRPQLQERLTAQLVEAIAHDLDAEGALAVVEARQLCMMLREGAAHGAVTVTSAATGSLREDPSLRRQAMELLGRAGTGHAEEEAPQRGGAVSTTAPEGSKNRKKTTSIG